MFTRTVFVTVRGKCTIAMLRRYFLMLIGLLLPLWWQCVSAYAPQRHIEPLTMGGKLHSRGYFANDLDILPYGVLQQLQEAAVAVAPWRYSRQMDWQTPAASQHQRVRVQPAMSASLLLPQTLQRQRQQQHQQQQQQHHWQQQRLRSSQVATKRMPRLQRMNDNFYNLYDVDGEHLLGLHYHNNVPAASQRFNAKSLSVAMTTTGTEPVGAETAAVAFNAADDDWRPMLPPSLSTPRPPSKPQLQSYRVRQNQNSLAAAPPSPPFQRDSRQVQHFWLQL